MCSQRNIYNKRQLFIWKREKNMCLCNVFLYEEHNTVFTRLSNLNYTLQVVLFMHFIIFFAIPSRAYPLFQN